MGQPPVLLLPLRFPLLFRRGRPPGRPEPDLHKIHTLRRGRCPHRPAPPNFLFSLRRVGCLQPAAGHAPYSRQGTRALPYKTPCRAGPMCPAANNRCISGNVSLRTSDRRHWCGNPFPYTVPLVPHSVLSPHHFDFKSPVQRQIRLGCGPHQIP